jgi:inward rectifier potassium channel
MADRHNRQIVTGPVERRGLKRAILSDLYHFLIDKPWSALLGLIAGFYVVVNGVFAALYMLGGDCVSGADPHSFRDHFFFSVQTIATIGYGVMAPKTDYAHWLVVIEAFLGTLFVALLTGLVFAKFSRPTARVLWSKHVVIFERGGKRQLMFRMANARANQIVEAQLRVVLARNEVSEDGERMRRFHDLTLMRERTVLFILSWTATHVIDAQSPLHGLTLDELKAQGAQLICAMMGIDESFSQQVHSRHVYTPEDFVLDQRFADIIFNNPDGSRYIDYARFDDLVPVGTRSEAA